MVGMPQKDKALVRVQAARISEIGKPLKKSVDTLAIVPTKDRISILARKVYNVMMHYAQEQGVEQPIYRVRLRDVVNGIDFNSKNTCINCSTNVLKVYGIGYGSKWKLRLLLSLHFELKIADRPACRPVLNSFYF